MNGSSEQLRLRIYLGLFAAVMILGTAGFMVAEGLSLGDALYFTIVTIATVGYGDISPATAVGKLLAVVLMVTVVGTFVVVVANATEIFLSRREGKARRQKLQMIIGLFFSEAGGELLRRCALADPQREGYGSTLIIDSQWGAADFAALQATLPQLAFKVEIKDVDLAALRQVLNERGAMLVRLLENPHMLEHEAFSDLLIAILHLKEELQHRADYPHLPASDCQHLSGDINRVYGLLVAQWVAYMQHLQGHYPFLFSLAMRTNPFDREASPIVS
ncbi:MAG: two pore domain potassium channel family protein [Desulfuromonas sp.]|nr:MAG: two pore domain potassium channel family protein [Desulfuromonas sp.]